MVIFLSLVSWLFNLYNIAMKILERSLVRHNKKTNKYDRILDAAYQLFLEQGYDEVSIQEIATRSGVAKGTFYLYFRDKDELKDRVIAKKSNEIFQRALNALHQTDFVNFEDQIVFVIGYVVDVLAQNKEILRLIAKNLSSGLFDQGLSKIFAANDVDVLKMLIAAAEKNGVHLKNPGILLYMIIELTSSTCFSCILYNEPLELAVYKPYLFDAIRQLIRAGQEDWGLAGPVWYFVL